MLRGSVCLLCILCLCSCDVSLRLSLQVRARTYAYWNNWILKWDLAVKSRGQQSWGTWSFILLIWQTFLRKARGYTANEVVACRSNSSVSKINIMLGQSPSLCPAITGLSEMTEGILWACSTWDEDRTGGCLWSHHTADYWGRQRDKSKAKSPIDHTDALWDGKSKWGQ